MHSAAKMDPSHARAIALRAQGLDGALDARGRHGRQPRGFSKSYDLTARVLPENIDRSMPAEEEAADFLIERALQAHGLAREPELRYLRDGAVAATIRKRCAQRWKILSRSTAVMKWMTRYFHAVSLPGRNGSSLIAKIRKSAARASRPARF